MSTIAEMKQAEAEKVAQAREHFEADPLKGDVRKVKLSSLHESPFNPRKKVGEVVHEAWDQLEPRQAKGGAA